MVAVGGGDEAAGVAPAVGAHAARVQPSGPNGADLGEPVPLADILANIKPELAEDARRQEENLQRRMADQQLLDKLARRLNARCTVGQDSRWTGPPPH
ncbi:MAG TPA: hypothetical protein VGP91_06850 [Actinoplanes sp.]|jgi:hypothetical protein|nr:hypothetical protein [Actinoplanes sp.]